jgi:hypothetical protein
VITRGFALVIYALCLEGALANSILDLRAQWKNKMSALHSRPQREQSFTCISLFAVPFSPPFVIPHINLAFPHNLIQHRNINQHVFIPHLSKVSAYDDDDDDDRRRRHHHHHFAERNMSI